MGIARAIIVGNLTRDPELRSLPSGINVCNLRVAVNDRRKVDDEWVDVANYFDVTVWGKQGENASEYLAKGRQVAVDGRLQWREWTDKEGNSRQSVDINADTVQFIGPKAESSAPESPAEDGPGW